MTKRSEAHLEWVVVRQVKGSKSRGQGTDAGVGQKVVVEINDKIVVRYQGLKERYEVDNQRQIAER